ncbi:hypothetical protein ACOTC8_30345 [Achromobacter xylosoxidans]|uniref:hypothetical protein n=1 Tax=Alcaligenes xylosoxydans xylosoxydans TaxID=85698 RepID=UPI0006C0ABE6|nr:hypothetical protein [Achromobacter xylosoxidans]CUJ40995.1 Uncharacterised protein [Achromobacter xylosoxidans]
MIQMLLGEFWPYLAGGFAIVLAYFGVRLKGKSDGRQEVQNQINKQAVESAKESRDVHAKVNRMGDGAANAELNRKWVRDKGAGGG